MSRRSSHPTAPSVGSGIIGNGPFDEDLHDTPKVLWIGVLIVCLGSLVAGAGVTAMHWGKTTDVWLLVGLGVTLGVGGVILLLANHVMTNVH